jgi:hypothetical protein
MFDVPKMHLEKSIFSIGVGIEYIFRVISSCKYYFVFHCSVSTLQEF